MSTALSLAFIAWFPLQSQISWKWSQTPGCWQLGNTMGLTFSTLLITSVSSGISELKEHLQMLSCFLFDLDADGQVSVKFGVLFADEKCANLFEALVGTLKAAKRRKIVTYQGELLLQGVHDNVDIMLLQDWCNVHCSSVNCIAGDSDFQHPPNQTDHSYVFWCIFYVFIVERKFSYFGKTFPFVILPKTVLYTIKVKDASSFYFWISGNTLKWWLFSTYEEWSWYFNVYKSKRAMKVKNKGTRFSLYNS